MTRHHIGGWVIWTLIIVCLAAISVRQQLNQAFDLALNTARTELEKDKNIRHWVNSHGGLYVTPTDRTPPNPHLKHLPGRDIKTSAGKSLTLMNPAYVISQMTREYEGLHGTKGHITSLKLLNPQNAPDPWEVKQLKLFTTGPSEAHELKAEKGMDYLRVMQPLITKKGCLKCHAFQGYKVGDVRGGISVTVPMLPFLKHQQKAVNSWITSFSLLWFIGIIFIYMFINRLQTVISQKMQINQIAEKHELLTRHHEELKNSNEKLKNALEEIKTLRGIIPICSYCKKIRDDKGAWDVFEAYISKHSEARFSHGACPECYKKQMEIIDSA